MSETEPTQLTAGQRRILQAMIEFPDTFKRYADFGVDVPIRACASALTTIDLLTATVAEQAQEIAAKETMIAATDAEAVKALLLLTDAEAKLREQAQEIERLTATRDTSHDTCRAVEQRLREANRRLQAEGPALERDKLIAAQQAKLQEQAQEIERLTKMSRYVNDDTDPLHAALTASEDKLRAVEALRDEANAALLTAYRALASIHGDAEDCDDCGTIAEAGEDGCRIHTGTRQARLMWEAVEAIEDTLGPCWCGHTRAEHNDCDERICEAKDCTCRCFKLSKLTAMLTLSSKESAT